MRHAAPLLFALGLLAPVVAICGFGSINGFTVNGLSMNGLIAANGLSAANGLVGANGFGSINGLSSANGLQTLNGFQGINGVILHNGLNSLNGIPKEAAATAPKQDSVVEGFADWLKNPYNIEPSNVAASTIRHAWRVRDAKITDTPEKRDLLKYFARCTLGDDQALVAENDGVTRVFQGSVGLAPKWVRRSLLEGEQRWVSACLLAHVNAHGMHVPIDLRGPHPRLSAVDPKDADYQIEEGAFFGNLFGAAPVGIACAGKRGAQDALSEFLKLRSCTELSTDDPTRTACGFVPAGKCADEGGRPTCTRGAGFFDRCRDPRTGQEYREIITVYLRR